MMGTHEVLKKAGIKDVNLITCYCCSPPDMKKVITEFEAPTKEALAMALQKIEFPVDSITEVTKVKLK
jgi:ribosomal protein S11